ncbi:MAG: hypothetical protein E7022_00030 [Desulfovibrio desulfuricans]|nr:hypothetical protein [Desulfovibrio desulfuricans]
MQELKLLPCPACGGPVQMTGGTEWHDQHEFWIECRNKGCGCVRVGDTEREECVRRWNSLPRKLRFSREKPTQDGEWYWYRDTEGEPAIGFLLDGCLTFLGGSYMYIDNAPGEFAGPIQWPEG